MRLVAGVCSTEASVGAGLCAAVQLRAAVAGDRADAWAELAADRASGLDGGLARCGRGARRQSARHRVLRAGHAARVWHCCWPPRLRCGSASMRWAAPISCGSGGGWCVAAWRGGGRARPARCQLASGRNERAAPAPSSQGVLTQLANVQALFFLASIFAGVGLLTANTATQVAAVGIIVLANGAYLSPARLADAARGAARFLRPQPRRNGDRFRPAVPDLWAAAGAARSGGVAVAAPPRSMQ